MEHIFKVFLYFHIAGGTLGLLAGTYITIAKKGDKLHKLVGKIFSVSMLGAGISSLILATIHHINFLFAVGVFTIYLVGTGWRFLYFKHNPKPILIDWLLFVFMILGCIGFIYMGLISIVDKEYFGVIILIFAWRGASFLINDYKIYKGQYIAKNYWLLLHFQRMMGAYIASLTAFAVVNWPYKLSFIAWLLPSIILVPLIVKWTNKYKIKIN